MAKIVNKKMTPTATPADHPAGINIADFRFRKSEDVVNHPSHYAPNGRDSFMHMKDQMGKAAFDGFLQGNAIKYVQRYAFKGKPTEDLCKAAFYLFHLAFETTDGSLEAVCKVMDRMTTTLHHAVEHYEPEVK